MKKISDNDLLIKIVSIVVSIVLWYIVLNTMNPIETRTLEVNLNVLNESVIEERSYGMIDTNYEKNVAVTIKGRQKDLENVTKNDFNATIDYNDFEGPGENILKVAVSNKNEEISLVNYEPSEIEANLEKIIEEDFPIDVLVSGQVEQGYKLIDTIKSNERVTVKGYKSIIDSIKSVHVEINVSDLSSDKSFDVQCKFIGEDGSEIKALENNESINVSVVVGKKVIVNITLEGEPADGYYLDDSDVQIEELYIKGPPEILSQIDEVSTRPISLNDRTESFETDIELIIPSNVEIAALKGKLRASVEIKENVEKTIKIRSNDILLTNASYFDYIYEVVTDSLDIIVKGKPDDINDTMKTDLNVLADVEALTPGIHKVNLEIEIFNDVYTTKQYQAVIRINDRMPEEEEEDEIIEEETDNQNDLENGTEDPQENNDIIIDNGNI